MKLQSFACPDDPAARMNYALKVLTQAAAETNREDGVPPVVVFDNVAHIMGKPGGLETIHLLQDYAKVMSDKKLCLFCLHRVKV